MTPKQKEEAQLRFRNSLEFARGESVEALEGILQYVEANRAFTNAQLDTVSKWSSICLATDSVLKKMDDADMTAKIDYIAEHLIRGGGGTGV